MSEERGGWRRWAMRWKCPVCGNRVGQKPWIFGSTRPDGSTKLSKHKVIAGGAWCEGVWSTTDKPKYTNHNA